MFKLRVPISIAVVGFAFSLNVFAADTQGWGYGIGFVAAPHGDGINVNLFSKPFHNSTNSMGVGVSGRAFFDWFSVDAKNVYVDAAGEFATRPFHVFAAGYRLSSTYESNSVFLLDIGVATIGGKGDFTGKEVWGAKLGFGALIPGYTLEKNGRKINGRMFVRMDQVVGTREADKITSKPDVFDGAYTSVGIITDWN